MIHILRIIIPDALLIFLRLMGICLLARLGASFILSADYLALLDGLSRLFLFCLGIAHPLYIFTFNLSWLLILPIKRWKLLIYKFLFSLIVSSMYGVGNYLLLFLFEKSSVHQSGQISEVAAHTHLAYLNGLLAGTVLIGYLLLISFFVLPNERGFPKHVWTKRQLYLQGILSFVFGSCIAYACAKTTAGVWIIALCSCCIGAGAIGSSAHYLRMEPAQITRITVIAGIFSLGLFMAPIWLASRSLQSKKIEDQAAAYVFLNPLVRAPKKTMVNFLKANLDNDLFSRLTKLYLSRTNDGKRLGMANPDDLRPEDVLSSSAFGESARVTLLFDPEKFEPDSFLSYLKKRDSLIGNSLSLEGVSAWWKVPVRPQYLLKLLQSDSPSAHFYSLVKMRYQRNPQYLPAILKYIRSSTSENDQLRSEAIKTLSVLSGKKFGIIDWKDISQPSFKETSVELNDVDCSQVRVPNENGVNPQAERDLNSCMRLRANLDKTTVLSIENFNWLSFPLSPIERAFVKSIFQ